MRMRSYKLSWPVPQDTSAGLTPVAKMVKYCIRTLYLKATEHSLSGLGRADDKSDPTSIYTAMYYLIHFIWLLARYQPPYSNL